MILWGGRFREKPDERMIEFSSSISFDKIFAKYELEIDRVWVSMLNRIGIVKDDELKKFYKAFDRVEMEIEKGIFEYRGFEDIHSAIDERVKELLGENISGKLTTGRSRNDIVVTEFRMYLRDKVNYINGLIKGVQRSLLEKAQEEKDKIMPVFTHLRVAMPAKVSHYLLSYFWMFESARKSFMFSLEDILKLPLGSGACAGTTIDIDRDFLKMELGFKEIIPNSIVAVSSRDFLLKYLFSCMILYLHLSRFSEDLIIYSSEGFSFVEIPERFSTGSSLMPQKRNPDFLELLRGKSARAISVLSSLSTVLKGLPLSYNRDLQEDKKDTFYITEELIKILELLPNFIKELRFNEVRMRELLRKGYAQATFLAEYLATKGIPYRKAHSIVGNIVIYCERNGKSIDELSLDELKNFSDVFKEDVFPYLSIDKGVELLKNEGTSGTIPLFHQIKNAYRVLERE
ncbi:MAG: argininosuccinate lyase [Caldiserica bacterium]|nr:MAG: argininosuccinate lyase [Caldisericota bacterium]